jgi:glycosyltransferase involved in cell wall biosynthesis
MSKKISFLIAAHNEEKVIEKALQNLMELPYGNYEVIVGLDGCKDGTEEIMKRFNKKDKKFKYFKLDFRKGKPEVIDFIIKKAEGEIIVIHDADWIFKVEDEEKIQEFVKVFDDEEIGGIVESFPVEWINLENSNLGYKIVAYGNYFWMKSQKEIYGRRRGKLIYIKQSAMFLTNIFRKELYEKSKTLGDDFERTYEIFKQGKRLICFEDESMPRMIANYNEIKIKDLIKQKIRTAIARKQITSERTDFKKSQKESVKFILINSWKGRIKEGVYANLWLGITILGEIIGKFKKLNTREGWKLRVRR